MDNIISSQYESIADMILGKDRAKIESSKEDVAEWAKAVSARRAMVMSPVIDKLSAIYRQKT